MESGEVELPARDSDDGHIVQSAVDGAFPPRPARPVAGSARSGAGLAASESGAVVCRALPEGVEPNESSARTAAMAVVGCRSRAYSVDALRCVNGERDSQTAAGCSSTFNRRRAAACSSSRMAAAYFSSRSALAHARASRSKL